MAPPLSLSYGDIDYLFPSCLTERRAAFPGTRLKQVQLTVVSHSDSPSGNEYLNLLFLGEVLNHKLSSKQAYMVWWIFGLRNKECGRKENKVVQ